MESFNYQEYLSRLNDFELKNAPKELYLEGDHSLLTAGRRVSVVGSRKPSTDGQKRAEIVTRELVERNIIVVSGLAEGIDSVAHNTAINNAGQTVAVLGTPLNKVYPKSNTDLLSTIKKNHLAISQFPEGYPSQGSNFPMRNRTMALISDATIIIEASEKSGTRHQGWEALRLGRQVFILQNIAENKSLSWPKEMLEYGAQILTRKNIAEKLEDIPYLTASVEFTF